MCHGAKFHAWAVPLVITLVPFNNMPFQDVVLRQPCLRPASNPAGLPNAANSALGAVELLPETYCLQDCSLQEGAPSHWTALAKRSLLAMEQAKHARCVHEMHSTEQSAALR